MSIFSRNKVHISNDEIRKIVIKWTGKGIRSLGVFGKLLQSVGIATPVTLCDFIYSKKSFECHTYDDKVLSIRLSPETSDRFGQLTVVEGKISFHYRYNKSTKSLSLTSIVTERNNRSLSISYTDSYYRRELTLPDDYYVTVIISDSVPRNTNNSNIFECKQGIEKYLFGLAFPCTAQDIYQKIMELYGFDNDIIPQIESIKVSVEKILSRNDDGHADKKRTMSEILTRFGNVFNYVINEDNIVYGINNHGDWFYSTPNAYYDFSLDTNSVSVTIKGHETEVCAINNSDMLKLAHEKINTIRDRIN